MKIVKTGYLFLTLVGLLSACISSSIASSPENMVTQDLIQNRNAVPDTIHIHQTQPWKNNIVVLVSYTSVEQGEKWSCESVYDMERSAAGWRMSGSGSGCSNPPNTDPVTQGAGSHGSNPEDYSYTYGLVTLNDAQWVMITWQDGFSQRVPVVNGSYLALREGDQQITQKIQILNIAEEVIHALP